MFYQRNEKLNENDEFNDDKTDDQTDDDDDDENDNEVDEGESAENILPTSQEKDDGDLIL